MPAFSGFGLSEGHFCCFKSHAYLFPVFFIDSFVPLLLKVFAATWQNRLVGSMHLNRQKTSLIRTTSLTVSESSSAGTFLSKALAKSCVFAVGHVVVAMVSLRQKLNSWWQHFKQDVGGITKQEQGSPFQVQSSCNHENTPVILIAAAEIKSSGEVRHLQLYKVHRHLHGCTICHGSH